jgi:hypothetical protein
MKNAFLLLMASIILGNLIECKESNVFVKPIKRAEVVTLSAAIFDELQIYNDTVYSITIVVGDDTESDYKIELPPGETFYKNARLKAKKGAERLARLLLYDIDQRHRRTLIYLMRRPIANAPWKHIAINVSTLLSA